MHPTSRGKTQNDGWTVDQGLAAQYAAQAGLDPDLAADAGEAVWDVLKSLRDATSETDPGRQAKLVKRTKARLAKANLSRHGELVQHIEARLLAIQGRGGDTELAHLTPGEVIVPPQLQTPEVIQAIQQAAQNAGVDMAQYTAGSQASSVNPETGMAEYSLPPAGIPNYTFGPGIGHVANPYGDSARGHMVSGPNEGQYLTTYFENLFADGSLQKQFDDAKEEAEGPIEEIVVTTKAPDPSSIPGFVPDPYQIADANPSTFFDDSGSIILPAYDSCDAVIKRHGLSKENAIATGLCNPEDNIENPTGPNLLPPVPTDDELSGMSNEDLESKIDELEDLSGIAENIPMPPGFPQPIPSVLKPIRGDARVYFDYIINIYQGELNRRGN